MEPVLNVNTAIAADGTEEQRVKKIYGRDHFGRFLRADQAPSDTREKRLSLTKRLEYYMELSVDELREIDVGKLPAKDALAVKQILAGIDAPRVSDATTSRHYSYDRIDGRPAQAVSVEADEEAQDLLVTIAERLRQRQLGPVVEGEVVTEDDNSDPS